MAVMIQPIFSNLHMMTTSLSEEEDCRSALFTFTDGCSNHIFLLKAMISDLTTDIRM